MRFPSHPSILRPALLALAFALAPAVGDESAAAATSIPNPPTERPPPSGDEGDLWLEAEPLGLRFRPPTPALAKAESLEGVFRYEVVDAQATPRWWLRFQYLTSSSAGLSARDQVMAYLDAMRRNEKEFTIRVDEAIRPVGAGEDGQLLVIEAPVGDGSTGLSGWLLVPSGRDRFLACSLAVPTDGLATTIPALRKAFAEMQMISVESVEAAKRERVERGARMLAFDEAKLRAALRPEPVVYRIYRPASSGSPETELGWMTIRVVEGRRGEVDPNRPASRYRDADNDEGLLVILDAKSLVSQDGRTVVDTQTRAWMAWDRLSEVWSSRSTQRTTQGQGTASRTTAQTGIRTPARPGQPRPRLEVINSVAEQQTRDPLEWSLPPNYLSQAELLVLGKLLPKDAPAAQPYASYAFDPRSNTLPQRTDEWRRNADGTWTLETEIPGSPQNLIQIFAADGERLKRIDHDGVGPIHTERIEVDALRALWRRKGLPLE